MTKNERPLFTPLYTPAEIAHRDELAAVRFGLPARLLMENAGREAYALLQEEGVLKQRAFILVIMGGGNNGGDGAVLARYLHNAGHAVLVRHTRPLSGLRGAARLHALAAKKAGVPFLPLRNASILPLEQGPPTVIVDALLGTGMQKSPRDKELAWIRAMNAWRDRAFLYSLDLPSGLHGLYGTVSPEAVRAHLTVTFAAGKPGLFMPQAAPYTGRVVIRPIGMPSVLERDQPPSWRLLSPQADRSFRANPLRHKGEAGKILIVGASPGMTGAPVLAALGALRAGAGIVHVACPAGLEELLHAGFPEFLTHAMGRGPSWEASGGEEILSLMTRLKPDALVAGPGLGRTPEARTLVLALLRYGERCPLILDADALHVFHPQAKGREDDTPPGDFLGPGDILTPHPGEMAALLAYPEGAARIQADRIGAVRAFIRTASSVLVLKGAGTLIAQADSPLTLAPFAVPCLGVAGSGDVLSGVCAALVASGLPSLEAACLAVYLHGRAGELLHRDTPRGRLARDIADAIPQAWAELEL